MFDSSYPFYGLGLTKSLLPNYIIGIRHYGFKTAKHRYLVEVECYENNIYIIQYYSAHYKTHPKKYMIMTNEFKCTRIVGTCINIMLEILKKDNLASFGFIGSNTYNPDTKEEESIDQTQRWRVYKHAMEGRMGTETFSHAWLPEMSRYVMVNNAHDPKFILREINVMFDSLYDKE